LLMLLRARCKRTDGDKTVSLSLSLRFLHSKPTQTPSSHSSAANAASLFTAPFPPSSPSSAHRLARSDWD
jgi:hypothetical protein